LPKWQRFTPARASALSLCTGRTCRSTPAGPCRVERMDNGKPIRESRDIESRWSCANFYHHAAGALLIRNFPGYTACGVGWSDYPLNFPLLCCLKIAPAFGTATRGSQPAEFTPLPPLPSLRSARKLDCRQESSHVTGEGSTCEQLVKHPAVSKIAFTGSTKWDAPPQRHCVQPKRLSLELGGKSPFSSSRMPDLDSAVEGLVTASGSSGTVCCAGSRY